MKCANICVSMTTRCAQLGYGKYIHTVIHGGGVKDVRQSLFLRMYYMNDSELNGNQQNTHLPYNDDDSLGSPSYFFSFTVDKLR